MAAGKLDLIIEQGATFTRTVTIQDSAGATVDLTGRTVRGSIRKKYSDAAKVVDFTCTLLNQVTDEGKFTVELTAAETSAIPVKPANDWKKAFTEYCYDIELVNGPDVERVLEGIAMVSPEVTR